MLKDIFKLITKNKNMKVLVQYSGGKDSQACLVWAVKKYGVKNIRAIFCNTYWDSDFTYHHVKKTCISLGVELKVVSSSKYSSFQDMARKKGIVPSSLRRFCTTELKINPFIDYLLDEVKENVLIIQGIRALESKKRSLMEKSCSYFKYYFKAYRVAKRGEKVYFNYRKKEVLKWVSKYDDSLFRPVFEWSGQEVIDYIVKNKQKPNELYYMGFRRVGCFPCVMSSMAELKELLDRFPERVQIIYDFEEETGLYFFNHDYIPVRFRTGIKINKKGEKVLMSTAKDIFKYIDSKYAKFDLFSSRETPSCSSFYYLCE